VAVSVASGAAASVALAAAWATHLTDSITSSARPGHPPFAERNVMEVASTLLCLDVGRPDHFAPLLGFFGDQLAELGRRSRQRRAAEVSEGMEVTITSTCPPSKFVSAGATPR
jgi:hypothetical protein